MAKNFQYSAKELNVSIGTYRLKDYSQVDDAISFSPITESGSIIPSTDAFSIVTAGNVVSQISVSLNANSRDNTFLALLEKARREADSPDDPLPPALAPFITGGIFAIPFSLVDTYSDQIIHASLAWTFIDRAALSAPKTPSPGTISRVWNFHIGENPATLIGALSYNIDS